MGAHDWTDNAAFGAAVRTDVDDVDEHEITVHRVADLMWGDENVAGEARLE